MVPPDEKCGGAGDARSQGTAPTAVPRATRQIMRRASAFTATVTRTGSVDFDNAEEVQVRGRLTELVAMAAAMV